MTWIIEIASQILFSQSASVGFEVLVGRDERSLDLGFAAVAGHGHGAPGQVKDHQYDRQRGGAHPKGVYSRAVQLVVEDTEALWDKPALPTTDSPFGDGGEEDTKASRKSMDAQSKMGRKSMGQRSNLEKEGAGKGKIKKQKIHLVVLTHGLHSNIGADMLYLKESIDATVKQAREDARKRKAAYKASKKGDTTATSEQKPTTSGDSKGDSEEAATAPTSGGQEDLKEDDDEEDEEQVIVRGFKGNAVRTERGIQYLGKRLAKFVLHTTYPDQPFMPVKKSMSRSFTDTFTGQAKKDARDGPPAHGGSSIHKDKSGAEDLAYTFTSISFIGHSLGGLIQTYAIAYIQKHAPHFFEQIKPINFICMASPLLGLSNENPMYVKFALDFGLVGRTGQDLGLTWRAPTIAKNGWSAMMSGFGSGQKEQKQPDPGAKPLLRILPTGPAHQVLRMFRNRTVYSNVVNDGIVPLRTSCLLFLDWRGLGKVEKARRQNGLVGTMAEWGWAELTGANTFPQQNALDPMLNRDDSDADGTNTPTREGQGDTVPQPPEGATTEDAKNSSTTDPDSSQFVREDVKRRRSSVSSRGKGEDKNNTGMLDSFLNFFRPNPNQTSPKMAKAIRRGQTVIQKDDDSADDPRRSTSTTENPTMIQGKRPLATRGDSMDHGSKSVSAPPRTSILESASDILNPPLPSMAWLTDPSSRGRTIFHDRVYHPEDIPPPPIRRPTRLGRSFSSDSAFSGNSGNAATVDSGSMKVEEKIARAYHKDLSWRKVLVRLEPDAHNNIIVRRMFANAYGWPVVKHLCDTHFADTWSARTRDEDEPALDRAQGMPSHGSKTGDEVQGQHDKKPPPRPAAEMREATDELTGLEQSREGAEMLMVDKRRKLNREESAVWDDSYFEGDEDDDDDDEAADRHSYRDLVQRYLGASPVRPPAAADAATATGPNPAPNTPSSHPSRADLDYHRGLGSIPTGASKSRPHPNAPKTPTKPQPAMTTTPDGPSEPAPAFTGQLVDEPAPLSPGGGGSSAARLGLRKSLDEVIAPPRSGGSASASAGRDARGSLGRGAGDRGDEVGAQEMVE